MTNFEFLDTTRLKMTILPFQARYGSHRGDIDCGFARQRPGGDTLSLRRALQERNARSSELSPVWVKGGLGLKRLKDVKSDGNAGSVRALRCLENELQPDETRFQ